MLRHPPDLSSSRQKFGRCLGRDNDIPEIAGVRKVCISEAGAPKLGAQMTSGYLSESGGASRCADMSAASSVWARVFVKSHLQAIVFRFQPDRRRRCVKVVRSPTKLQVIALDHARTHVTATRIPDHSLNGSGSFANKSTCPCSRRRCLDTLESSARPYAHPLEDVTRDEWPV